MRDAVLVDVAIPVPLRHALTYRLPDALADAVHVGSRVLIELGRRRVTGVVLERRAESDGSSTAPTVRLKDILDVVEADPVVPAELVRFLRELASYYLAPIGEVMRLALPAVARGDAARLGDNAETGPVVGGRRVQYAAPTDQIEAAGTLRGNAIAVLHFLRANGPTPVARLTRTWKTARTIVSKLVALKLATTDEREVPRDPYFRDLVPVAPPHDATAAQQSAMTALDEAIHARKPHTFLLHGVTGSGKTEVYLHAIATAKAAGLGSLMLVPEIALTPQLVARFRARFGDGLAVLHSGLVDRDRLTMWQALRRGDVDVAIGARSALFAPVHDLGLLIVDEEHDASFKQEEGVRYHARDMAMLRAHRTGAVCVLGSATPSMESEHLARSGKITRLRLPARAREASRLPEVRTIDLRRTGAGPSGDKRLSLPLHRAMQETLDRGQQVLLFLNRRGFAPSVVCNACGVIAQCPSCSVALTFHRSGRLRCHYCDFEQAFRERCEACGSADVSLEGAGTERLETSVAEAFPGARIARMDRDVAAGARAEAIFEKLRRQEIDILIGTQMVAKGHDIPTVTLVGVINADAALSMPDFRAAERTFQLLVQVAGRAGRGETPGLVLLQTRDPQHPAIALAKTHDVNAFAERELQLRAELGYPPFSRLALVRVDAPKEDGARDAAAFLARQAAGSPAARRGQVDVLGPAPAPIARLRDRYRFRLLLKARERAPLRSVLGVLEQALATIPRSVRVILDVDPMSML